MTLLDSFEPSPTWYLYNPYGIHGIGHAARVLVWAEQLSSVMIEQGTDVDQEIIRWASVRASAVQIDLWR